MSELLSRSAEVSAERQEFIDADTVTKGLFDFEATVEVISQQLLITPERAKELCVASLVNMIVPGRVDDSTKSLRIGLWSDFEHHDGHALRRGSSGTSITVSGLK